ncbi:MAG: glycosyltransferase family 1 protein [Nitrospirota bacterium]
MQRYGGISRYFYEIIHAVNTRQGYETCLPIRISANHYLKKLPALTYRNFDHILKGLNWIVYKINRAYTIKNTARFSSDFDVFHPTYYDPYFLPYCLNKPFVLTIHDMIHDIFPEYFSMFSRISSNKRTLARRASRIIAVSENTKKDIVEQYGICEDKITVIYHGVSFFPQENHINISVPEKYLLFVGDRHKYKNFLNFIKSIAAILSEKCWFLVCCGGGDFSGNEKLVMRDLKIDNKVIMFSGDDGVLAYLYRHARVFVCPSLYEGFGIPVLEAMSCGCPVASSNVGSLPEVGGDAVSYFDPYDMASMEGVVRRIIYDKKYRLDLIDRGLRQARHFSWDKAADETCGVYQKALESKEVSSVRWAI